MRIAFFVNSYWPRLGGLESHVAALAAELVALGNRVDVFTLAEGRAEREVRDGVTIHRWPMQLQVGGVFSFPKRGFRRWVLAELGGEVPDVISVHTRFFPLTWFGAKFGRKLGVPVIHTEHGSGFVVSPSPVIRYASRAVDLTLGRAAMRRASRVVAVSENAAAFASRVSGGEATVFYNAIHLPGLAGGDAAADAVTELRGPREVVFVGRIVAGKGWDTTLEAVARLQRDRGLPDGSVHFLGQGAEFEALGRRVRELGLERVAVVHGQVDATTVTEMLRGNVLINPTVLAEGFQTTLLEAIAASAEVVTFPVPGAEVLRNQGFPVEIVGRNDVEGLAKAVRRAMDAPAAEPDRAQLERWSWPHRAREYEALCREIAS